MLYMYIKSVESATTMIIMVTILQIVQKEKKRSHVRTVKWTGTSLKNVTAGRSMGKNSCTMTIRAINKRSSGRKKDDE